MKNEKWKKRGEAKAKSNELPYEIRWPFPTFNFRPQFKPHKVEERW
jgi:hypothetical protein